MASGGLGRLGGLGSKRSVRPLRNSGRPLAIDFGVGSLKLLQLDNSEQPKLIAAVGLDTPEELLTDAAGRLRYQMEALPKIVRSGGFKTQRTVCSIPAGLMFCKHLRVQKTDGVSVSDLAAAAVAKQMGCDPNALLCRHVEIANGGSKGQTEIICMASGRPLVGRLMQSIKHARLEPVGVHGELDALLIGLARDDSDEQGEATAYIDLGRGTTKVIIAHNRQMLFARTVGFGGLHMDQAVQLQTGGSLTEARKQRLVIERFERVGYKMAAGAEMTGPPGPSEGGIDLDEPLEIMTDEIKMCLRYHRTACNEYEVRRAVFVGSESTHTALCDRIGRDLGLRFGVMDPFDGLRRTGREPVTGIDLNAEQPGWAVPVGMCLSPTDL